MKFYKNFILLAILGCTFLTESCGPVVISSAPDNPPPTWFYPNRLEVVRYIYFPDFNIYYDISLRHYIYFENSVWVTVNILPPRYAYIDLNRAHYVRIQDYHGNNIRSYHQSNRYYNSDRVSRSIRNSRSHYEQYQSRSSYERSRTLINNRSTRTRSKSDRSRTRTRDSLY